MFGQRNSGSQVRGQLVEFDALLAAPALSPHLADLLGAFVDVCAYHAHRTGGQVCLTRGLVCECVRAYISLCVLLGSGLMLEVFCSIFVFVVIPGFVCLNSEVQVFSNDVEQRSEENQKTVPRNLLLCRQKHLQPTTHLPPTYAHKACKC